MHLIIDGYRGDPTKMWDEEMIRWFLWEYPSRLGMKRICEPQVVTYNGPRIEDSGVSGFVVIAESHISIHTFPYRDYVNIDVFSCKSFDSQRVLRDMEELFSLGDVRTWLMDRGLEHLGAGKAPSLPVVGREVGQPAPGGGSGGITA